MYQYVILNYLKKENKDLLKFIKDDFLKKIKDDNVIQSAYKSVIGDNMDIIKITEEQNELWKYYKTIIKKKVDFRTWVKWEEKTKQLNLI